jgi:hypothetical protein
MIKSRMLGLGTALAFGAIFSACDQQIAGPGAPSLAKSPVVLFGTVSLSASGGTLVDPVAETTGDEYCDDVSVTVSWTYDDGIPENVLTSYLYGSLDVHFNGVEFAEDNAAGIDGLQEGDAFSISTTFDTPAGSTSGSFTAGGMGKDPKSKKAVTFHTAPTTQAYSCVVT